jgi:hypothetical protein
MLAISVIVLGGASLYSRQCQRTLESRLEMLEVQYSGLSYRCSSLESRCKELENAREQNGKLWLKQLEYNINVDRSLEIVRESLLLRKEKSCTRGFQDKFKDVEAQYQITSSP